METLIYPDTNFYIDYFEDRRDNIRPLGEFAFSVLKRTFKCEFKIVISDLVIDELERHISEQRIAHLVKELEDVNKLVTVKQDYDDVEKARILPTHQDDALHAVLAAKAGAKFLITRNIQHFLNVRHLIQPILPENL